MSDTVKIAIITLIAGIAGALIGLMSSYIVSKITASSQIKQTVLQEYFKERHSAFSQLLIACDRMMYNPFDDDNIFGYTEAIEVAILIASPSTSQKIEKFKKVSSACSSQEEKDTAYSDMVEAMRLDLLNYSEPSIKKLSVKQR